MNGIINVYKPKGITSHDVVWAIKKALNQKKVGHTGTLDPFASGVLPICVGEATKLSQYIMEGKKYYRAKIVFGCETDSQDAWGKVHFISKFPDLKENLPKVISRFLGEQFQIPPMYSAIKVNGSKLYDLARKGIEIDREPRKVHIDSIEVIDYLGEDSAIIDIVCSKGTYIRTLCNDIGRSLNSRAIMADLERRGTGRFSIENSFDIQSIKSMNESNCTDKFLFPMEYGVTDLPKVTIRPESIRFALNGVTLINKNILEQSSDITQDSIVAIMNSNELIALGKTKFLSESKMEIKIERVFNKEKYQW